MTPEQQAVLRSVRKLVDFWRIEPEELAFEAPERTPSAEVASEPPGPKYRHPRTGEIWDGEGVQPPWLREALTKQGYTVDELRINSPLNGGQGQADVSVP
jgi:DNA-binding protein H-NS